VQKAAESQTVDLRLLASTPMHDRLTFERAQAVEEKAGERLRRNGGCAGKTYQGWMAEVDRQVAHHERGGERSSQSFASPSASAALSSAVPKKRSRQQTFDGEGSRAESSRAAVSRRRRVSGTRDEVAANQTASDDGDTDTVDTAL